MTSMPHLPSLRRDFKDQLAATTRQVAAQPETTTYAYDATGLRVRKVVRRQNGSRRSERLYLADVEIYREFGARRDDRDAAPGFAERHGRSPAGRSRGGRTGAPPVLRFQVADALESAGVELDASGAVISFEELTPFGTFRGHLT